MANFGREYYPVDPRDDDKASELAKRQARAQLRANEEVRRQYEKALNEAFLPPDEQVVNALLDSMGVRHA